MRPAPDTKKSPPTIKPAQNANASRAAADTQVPLADHTRTLSLVDEAEEFDLLRVGKRRGDQVASAGT